ncbi:Highly reducing polyketide synthase gloL [Cladobotryum mycophilum]|uniref:Highly reducing polyketide synthase gloL n=1 Tax=Cladobotryum mycophilum TaxID=491253 RepID=A0ABR0SZK5_9HYPO
MASPRDPVKPIAVIGMSMRLPGGVSTADDFWRLLMNKEDGRCRVPESRYNVDGFRGDSRRENVGTEYGFFLPDANLKAFDTSFFTTTRAEALMTDPQQRILMEVVWECIESAGATNLQGTNTGVYVGNFGEDWHQLVHQDTQSSSPFRVSNTSDFIISNKISYQFDLRGPSLTIRTACSAAMTGLHLACQALQNGECPAAIVAGSSLILGPSMTQDMTAQGVLSPDGTCKTFDAAADGFARAEGFNAILIKPLEDAIRDNDPIRAVIRSTSANSDGRLSSIGAPSAEAQVQMIQHAYSIAGIDDLSQTAFVECHGTGTMVGDPIEATAVGEAFGDAARTVYIGSVKPNLGHTEGASGLTSVIKAVLALENEIIPPNINFSTPNPKIPFEKYNLKVPVEPIPWPTDRHCRVSVNSFGIGGANAHVILDSAASFGIPRRFKTASTGAKSSGSDRGNESNASNAMSYDGTNGVAIGDSNTDAAKPSEPICDEHLHKYSNDTNGVVNSPEAPQGVDEHRPTLLVLSATSESSLKARAADIERYIEARASSVDAIAHTLGTRRIHLPHRAFAIMDGTDEPPRFTSFRKPSGSLADIVFTFTGQGAQWAGMGGDLCHWMPSFLSDIREMDRALSTLSIPPEWKIEDLLCSETDSEIISKAELAQPLSTALQISLARLLINCGIKPSAVVGHSSGEIAAAFVAGALTLDEAIICSYQRGLIMKRAELPAGRMAAVGLSCKEVSPFLVEGVRIACENSPKSVTLSGDAEAVEKVVKAIKDGNKDTFVRLLHVEVAYHSHHMSYVGQEYQNSLGPYVSAKQASLPFYSSVTGHLAPSGFDLGPSYWRTNLESPVLFSSAVRDALHDLNNPVLVEVGPHSALKGPLRQIFQAHMSASNRATYLPTIIRNESSTRAVLATLGELFSLGHTVNLASVNPASHVLVDLPLYPWDHSMELWHESRISRDWRLKEHPHHELLGTGCSAVGGTHQVWRNLLTLRDVPWLGDHVIVKDVVFPCAAYVTMMGEAIRQVTGSKAYQLRDVVVRSAMVIPESDTIELMTIMNLSKLTDYTQSSWYEFSISSFNGSSWVQHCIAQGKAAEPDMIQPSEERLTAILSSLPRKIPEKYLYRKMEAMGLNFGHSFRSLQDVSAHTEECIARATVREVETRDAKQHAVHPITIDACLQLSGVATSKGVVRQMRSLKVPARIGSLYVGPGEAGSVIEAVERAADGTDIIAITRGLKVIIDLQDVKFIRLDAGDDQSSMQVGQSLSRLEWRPDIDFSNPQDLLQGLDRRDTLQALEKITTWCILQWLDVIDSTDISSPPDHLAKFVKWLKEEKQRMLRGEYVLVPQAAQWALANADVRKSIPDDLAIEVGSLDSIGLAKMFEMCSIVSQPGNIKAIASGELHPLQVYMDTGGLYETYILTNNSLYAGDFFRLCGHSQPNLRVLEIGGGTAGTTEVVLSQLTSNTGTRTYASYTFTDISAGFFTAARGRLKNWQGIEYKTLDITKDPTEQGFSRGAYDLVIAANGLLPGWWVGDGDGRAEEPAVSRERWDQELRSAGFGGIEAIGLNDDENYQFISHIISSVPYQKSRKDNFLLLYNRERPEFASQLASILDQNGIRVSWASIHDKTWGDGQDILAVMDLENPFFSKISDEDYTAFMACLAGCKGGLLWLTRSAQVGCINPDYGLVNGFARTVRLETSIDFWTAELQNLDSLTMDAVVSIAARFLERTPGSAQKVDCEFSVHDGQIHIGRYDWSPMAEELHSHSTLNNDDPKQVVVGRLGMLDSIGWVQSAAPSLQPDEIEIRISCVGLNFRDVMMAMGILPGKKGHDSPLGLEAAGVVTRVGSNVNHLTIGDRVMTMYAGLFATRRVIPGNVAFRIPDDLSFEGAATMCVVYGTVIYAIIHKACGGVGQAAIQICQMLGADIYVTVGSEEKVQFIQQHYGISRERIFNSRNASFYDDLMCATAGNGVDLVLNSLSGELLHASWKCVARWGKMMEIGKRDIIERGQVAMDMFNNNRTFYGISLDIIHERPALLIKLMTQVLKYYSEGHIKPIAPITIFPARDISDAFRYMQSGKHIGKIVVTMPEDASNPSAVGADKETILSSSRTYLLVGGLGGLGKAVTSWMVEKGARSFVFLSRSAGKSVEDQAFLLELKSQGCSTVTIAGSVIEMEDVVRCVEAAPTPIAGVIQMSMVLRDMAIFKMGYDDWNAVQRPKVRGTWNLHEALLGVNLDFFILFSSISGAHGLYGQANYSSANSFLGSFVQYRQNLGLPCSAIDIGIMDGVGIINTLTQDRKKLSAIGMTLVQDHALMEAIELCIKQSISQKTLNHADPSVAPRNNSNTYVSTHQISIGLESSKRFDDPENRNPIKYDIRMGLARQREKLNSQSTDARSEGIRAIINAIASDPQILNDATTLNQITTEIGRTLCGFAMIPVETMDASMTLGAMGIDSLVSIELRNWWRGTLGVEISVLEMMSAGTISRLGVLAIKSLKKKHGLVADEAKGEEVPET